MTDPMATALVFLGIAVAVATFTGRDILGDVRNFTRFAAAGLVALGMAHLLGLWGAHETVGGARLQWRHDLLQGLVMARQQKRPAMVYVTADWCASCLELKKRTLSDPSVVSTLKKHGFVPIMVDATRMDEVRDDLEKAGLDVRGLPLVVFYTADGTVNPAATLREFEPPQSFVARVEAALEPGRTARLLGQSHGLAEKGVLVALLLAMVAGVGVGFTPCVFPMVPVYLAVMGVTGTPEPEALSTRLVRGTSFLVGLSLAYSALGVGSALAGAAFGSWLGSGLLNLLVAFVFLYGAMALTGVVRVSETPVSGWLSKQRKLGKVVIAFMLGALSAVIAAPCAGPVLLGILAAAAQQGKVVFGAAAALCFAIGMATSIFVIGLGLAAVGLRIHSGRWNIAIQWLLGVGFLVLAIYYGRVALRSGCPLAGIFS